MGDTNAKMRKATLTARQVNSLYLLVMAAVASSRAVERRIDAAEIKLGNMLGASLSIDGSFSLDLAKLPEKLDCEFTELEMFGIKTAIVQEIVGVQSKVRAHHGRIKYHLLPIAKLLGIEAIVKKESALVESEEEKLTLTYDEDPAKEETKRLRMLEDKEPEAATG